MKYLLLAAFVAVGIAFLVAAIKKSIETHKIHKHGINLSGTVLSVYSREIVSGRRAGSSETVAEVEIDRDCFDDWRVPTWISPAEVVIGTSSYETDDSIACVYLPYKNTVIAKNKVAAPTLFFALYMMAVFMILIPVFAIIVNKTGNADFLFGIVMLILGVFFLISNIAMARPYVKFRKSRRIEIFGEITDVKISTRRGDGSVGYEYFFIYNGRNYKCPEPEFYTNYPTKKFPNPATRWKSILMKRPEILPIRGT